MALIKSISGIRGTIGGKPGESLSPIDVVKFTAAYGQWAISRGNKKIVIGRDGRISGPTISKLVAQTLTALGADVVDLGLSTTPTVEMEVVNEKAAGGIIITASHNPKEWNAFRFRADLELERSMEINHWLENHPEVTHWVAVDDLNMSVEFLSKYFLDGESDKKPGLTNFVLTPKSSEGIKQNGIKEKIIKYLKDE